MVSKGEEVDWFGIIILGSCIVTADNVKVNTLGIGDMIGYMKFSGMFDKPENEKHRFDIIGEDNGYLALIPFAELRSLFRRFP